MFSLLNELGGYVPPDAQDPDDLTPLIVSLLRLNGAPLFDVYLDIDLHNSSKLAPIIDLPLRFGFNTRFWWYQSRKVSHPVPKAPGTALIIFFFFFSGYFKRFASTNRALDESLTKKGGFPE